MGFQFSGTLGHRPHTGMSEFSIIPTVQNSPSSKFDVQNKGPLDTDFFRSLKNCIIDIDTVIDSILSDIW